MMTRYKKLSGIVAMGAALGMAYGAVPDLISYQHKLLHSDDTPVTTPTNLRFRIYLGGNATDYPSTGTIVYSETVLATPTPDGVISHFIGSGTPAPGCPEGVCALSADDFGDGTLAVWIEAMVDPDGTLNTSDDDVLLPRTRVGAVGFAYRCGSVEGASGGTLSGTITADTLTARNGATFGTGTPADTTLTFNVGSAFNPTIRWEDANNRFAFSSGIHIGEDVGLIGNHGTFWPTSYDRCTNDPVCTPSGTVSSKFVSGLGVHFSAGQDNNIFQNGYNYDLAGARITPGEPAFKLQMEANYWDAPARTQFMEWNLDYLPIVGNQRRFMYMKIPTGGPGATPGALDRGDWQWSTCGIQNGCQTFRINPTGDNIEIGDFQGNLSNKVYVFKSIRTSAVPSSQDGVKAVIDLNLDGTPAPYSFVGAEGISQLSNFSGGNTIDSLVGIRGHVQVNGTSAATRTVTSHSAGIEGRCWVLSGSTTVGAAACVGGRFQASAHGAGPATTTSLWGALIAAPGTLGLGTVVSTGGGLQIDDMKGYGVGNQAAIYVDPQTAASTPGAKGNIRMAGGNWNSGHLQLNAAHMWWDVTLSRLRTKSAATPLSETDGNALVTSSSDLTSGRVPFTTGGTTLADDAGMSYNAGTDTLTVGTVRTTGGATLVSNSPAFTSGRVPITTGGATVSDDAGLAFDASSDTLTLGPVRTGGADGTRGVTVTDNVSNPSAPAGGSTILHMKAGRAYVLPGLTASPGNAVVTGTGVISHGVVSWGDGSASFQNGNQTCTASGLTCVTVRMASGVFVACTQNIPGAFFAAFCR